MTETATTPAQEIDHSQRGHAEFGPSGLKYVAKCPGFFQPHSTNEFAEKGTRIHEAVEANDPSALHDEEEVTMFETIKRAEANFLSRFPFSPSNQKTYNEILLDIQLEGGLVTFGTCDLFVTWDGESHAAMVDYKTGISKIDAAQDNWQAKAYVVGAFQKFPEINAITFAFIVPKHDGDEVSDIMEATFERVDLPALVSELTQVITLATAVRSEWDIGPDNQIIAQPSMDVLCPSNNCRFCGYEEVCPAMGALVCEVAVVANPAAAKWAFDPVSKDPAEVEKRYLIAKIVEAWADREKRAALDMAKAGTVFPNLKLSSMGAPFAVKEGLAFYNLAIAFGLTHDELMDLANFPVTKTVDRIPKASRIDFKESAADSGFIEKQAERFTLKDK